MPYTMARRGLLEYAPRIVYEATCLLFIGISVLLASAIIFVLQLRLRHGRPHHQRTATANKHIRPLSPPAIVDIEDLDMPKPTAALRSKQSQFYNPFVPGDGAPLYPDGIRIVHLEITSKCNAACPQCSRNVNGGRDNPALPLVDLSLADVQRILDPASRSLSGLRKIFLCGNYGDPSAAKDCLAIVRWLRSAFPRAVVGVHSNGGAKAEGFWSELGELLQAPHGYCRFAIDGLEDTNHLYRQRVEWSHLMRNVRSFAAAGGALEWDFIAFRHNEHQVEAVRALALSLGVTRFSVKRTRRFVDKRSAEMTHRTPVEDRHGRVVRYLEPPSNPGLRNEADVVELRATLQQHGTYAAYLDRACVDCKAKTNAEVYISADALVFPCCFLGGELHRADGAPSQFLDLLASNGVGVSELQVGGRGGSDGGSRTLDEVLAGGVFTRLVSASWARQSIGEGKLRTCADVCGTGHKAFDRQFDQVERLQQVEAGRSSTMMASAPATRKVAVAAVRGVEQWLPWQRRRRVRAQGPT